MTLLARRLALLLATALLCVALPACTTSGGRASTGSAANSGRGGITVFGDIDASVGRR